MRIRILKYSHFIKIMYPSIDVRNELIRFAYQYSVKTFTTGSKSSSQPMQVYAGRKADHSEYRFHINQLPFLISFLGRRGIPQADIEIVEIPISADIVKTDLKLKEGIALRDYQEEACTYLSSEDKGPIRVVAYPTGAGKTVTALASVCKINQRTIIVILPTYITKWINDIQTTVDVQPEDIMVVQGSKYLRGLVELAKQDNLPQPFIIISSRTLQMFISAYDKNEDMDIGITPEELFPLLKAGVLLIDEAHQHLHAMFKILLHSHIPLQIGLSATLTSNNREIEHIQKVIYPVGVRFKNVDDNQHTEVYAVRYALSDPFNTKAIRTTEWGSTIYSHSAFEQSILRRPKLRENYFAIIDHIVLNAYVNRRKPGQKCIIFLSRVEMCTLFTDYLKGLYPELDIRRYCEDDPYENVIDADIRVTTLISTGAAIDIPGLITGILTVSVMSHQVNLQALGRLRNIPGEEIKYYYLFCEHIPKQVEYHNKKKELFIGQVKSQVERRHPLTL